MKPNDMLGKLEHIVTQSGDTQRLTELKRYLEKCFSPDSPSHIINISTINMSFWRSYNLVSPRHFDDYESLREQVVAWFKAIGYRDNIKTPQEDRLTGGSEDLEYADQLYKPIGLIKGEMTIEEARKARELARVSSALRNHYIVEGQENQMYISVTLEPLDVDGNTIRDPIPVDYQLSPLEHFEKAKSFPHRRD